MDRKKGFVGGTLFCGANSGRGFVSFFDDMLCGVDKVYIIKGGPGTGKSRLMRQAAEYAKKEGRDVEFFACSSDPDSLDGIVVDRKIAMVDGTAPHTLEPRLAGAQDETVDLGRFWDSSALASKKEEIAALAAKKGECYKRAYRYLDAATRIKGIDLALSESAFLRRKAERAVKRIFENMTTGGGYEKSVGMIDSVGMKGRVRLNTYVENAERVYAVEDNFGSGTLFLRLMLMRAVHTDTPVIVSYDPIDAESPTALFFKRDKRAYILTDKKEGTAYDAKINMARFMDKRLLKTIKSEYRQNLRLEQALVGTALEYLAEAGKQHFALEAIYSSCMDFDAKEEYCNSLIKKIFG